MNKPMPKDKILTTFKKIGYNLDDNLMTIIFNIANKSGGYPQGVASCNMFRNVLNDYLDAVETNNAEAWIRANSSV